MCRCAAAPSRQRAQLARTVFSAFCLTFFVVVALAAASGSARAQTPHQHSVARAIDLDAPSDAFAMADFVAGAPWLDAWLPEALDDVGMAEPELEDDDDAHAQGPALAPRAPEVKLLCPSLEGPARPRAAHRIPARKAMSGQPRGPPTAQR